MIRNHFPNDYTACQEMTERENNQERSPRKNAFMRWSTWSTTR